MKRGRNRYARILLLSSAIYEAGVIIPEYRGAMTPKGGCPGPQPSAPDPPATWLPSFA